MNILHFIEKLPFILFELEEHYIIIYSILLYLIDTLSILRLYKKFNEKIDYKAFIPFYNWRIVFKYCWNDKAFWQHFFIEIAGLGIPFICEFLELNGLVLDIIVFVDLIIALWGLKHAIEISMLTLEAFDYNKYIGIPLALVFNIELILIAFGKKKYIGNKSNHH